VGDPEAAAGGLGAVVIAAGAHQTGVGHPLGARQLGHLEAPLQGRELTGHLGGMGGGHQGHVEIGHRRIDGPT